MKLLSKIFNNPLSLIVVLASVWYLTRDFIYFTLAIFSFITIQVALEKLTLGKVSKVLFFSWCVLIPFALMTLVLRDPIFLQWKFSIVHWLMGLILIIAHYFKGPSLLRGLFSLAGPQLETVPQDARRQPHADGERFSVVRAIAHFLGLLPPDYPLPCYPVDAKPLRFTWQVR